MKVVPRFWSFLAQCTLGLWLCTVVNAEPIQNDSRVLFLGPAASEFEAVFAALYSADASVNSSNIATSSMEVLGDFPDDGYLNHFYRGRNTAEDKNALINELDMGYDYIVLIPFEQNIREQPEMFMEGARLIQAYVRSLGTEIIIPMIWDGNNAVGQGEVFEEHSYRIADALGVPCVPVGLAWEEIMADNGLIFSESSPDSPSSPAQYIFATTLYAHFFEQSATNSTYDHAGLNPAEEDLFIFHAFNAWNLARTASHYSGEYTSAFCSPFEVPHVFDHTSEWTSMGTSTESRARAALITIIGNHGGDVSGAFRMNGYDYDDKGSAYRYFDLILDHPDAQAVVQRNNFDFAFGRADYGWTDYTSKMNHLHSLDPDAGGDTRFIVFAKHYSRDLRSTLYWAQVNTFYSIAVGRSHPDAYGIPNTFGFGRAWQERPDLVLVQSDDQHLSQLGDLMQAAMIYALVTGANPAVGYDGWSEDELYVLQMAFKMVVELGGLRKVITPPIAYDGEIDTESGVVVPVPFDGMDLDELPLSVVIVSGPSDGELSGSGLSLSYQSDPGFSGTETITYRLSNGTALSNLATMTMQVENTTPAVLTWERGRVEGVDNAAWQTVRLENEYSNMVVLTTPIYGSSQAPTVARIRNASGNQFEIMAQTATGSTVLQPEMAFEYFVVESGVYTEAGHGVKMEALTYLSTVTDAKSSWTGEAITYRNTYTDPVVLGQVMSANDSDYSYFWSFGESRDLPLSPTAIFLGKSIGDDAGTPSRADEVIAYLVIEAGSGTLPGEVNYHAAVGAPTVEGVSENPPYDYEFAEFDYIQGVIATQAGMTGNDGSWALLYSEGGFSETHLSLAVDEDTMEDAERVHSGESVSYLLFSSSTEVEHYLPASRDADANNDGVPDLVQFTAGHSFDSTAPNPVATFTMEANDESGISSSFEVKRRENLAFFGLSQRVMLSSDLENWYDLESVDFPFNDISHTRSLIQSGESLGDPVGVLETWRYTIAAPPASGRLFLKVEAE